MFKSCLSLLFILLALAVLAAAYLFLSDTSKHTKFERLPIDEERFAP